ncbi:MAG: MFS transporter [Solirubrobacterales bacterium]
MSAERGPRAGLALAGLLLASAGPSLSQTLVVPALAEIERHFDASADAATWALTGFLLSVTVSTPLAGKLGDVYGRRRVLIGVIAAFAAGSVACALADSIEVLIAGRIVQGVSGGVFPLAFGIIRETFPPARVPTAIGAVSATFGIGAALGLSLSGVLVEGAGLDWLFWIGLAIVPAAGLVAIGLPAERPRRRAGIDWLGALLLSGALGCVLVGVSNAEDWGWGSAATLGALGGGLGLAGLFAATEARRAEPLVDLVLLRARPVLMSNLTGLAIGFVMFAAFLLIPRVAQEPEASGYGLSASVSEAGLLMAPGAVAMICAGPLAGVLASRRSSRAPLALGAVAATAALTVLTASHGDVLSLTLAVIALGAGIGFVFAAMANVVVESVPSGEVGIATGINTITRTIGGALGAQVAIAIVSAGEASGGTGADSPYTEAFVVSAVIACAAVAAALAVPRARRPVQPEPDQPLDARLTS